MFNTKQFPDADADDASYKSVPKKCVELIPAKFGANYIAYKPFKDTPLR